MLRENKKTDEQRRQAMFAIFIYFEMEKRNQTAKPSSSPCYHLSGDQVSQTSIHDTLQQPVNIVRKSYFNEEGYKVKTESPEWDEVLARLSAEIKVRHYSRKTLQTYAIWSRKFQYFLKNKPPQDLTTADVKAYLTYLAVDCHVAASTQNQVLIGMQK